jgi:predicted ATPase
MISKLQLKNFKAFDDLEIDLSPITLLLGPNNAGKSAIIAAFRLLLQTIDSNDDQVPLLMNGRFGDFGTYRDVVHGNHRGRPIKIDIDFEFREDPRYSRGVRGRFPDDSYNSVHLALDFKYRTRRREIILRATEIRADGRILLSTHYSEDSERQLIERIGQKQVPVQLKSSISRALRIQNYVPYLYPAIAISPMKRDSATSEFITAEIENQFDATRRLSRRIVENLKSIEYIGALRASPSRTYLFAGERRRRVGQSGENAISLIVMDAQRQKSRMESIVSSISSWLSKAGIGSSLEINPLSDRHFEVRVNHPVTKESQNLADIGYGISQILPVLAGGYALRSGSTYMVEEPEIHLHPRAQAELGSFFYELYSNGVYSLVETHSEYLILRLQQYVAQGLLAPKDLRVIYVYPSPKGKKAIPLLLDEKGYFLDEWPEGFFPERLEEAKRLSRLRRGS